MTNPPQPSDEPIQPADDPYAAYPPSPDTTARPSEPRLPAGPGGWGYRDILYLLLFAVPAQIVAMAICIGAMQAYGFITGADTEFDSLLSNAPLVVAIQFVWWAMLLAFIYGIVAIKYRLPFWSALGWRGIDRPPSFYLLFGVLLAVSVAALSQLMPMPTDKMPMEELLKDRTSLIIVACFGVLLAPAIEELVFRGFLYGAIERAHGPALAVFLTSALFSLPHASQYGWRWQNLLLLTYVGIIFGTVRARTKSVVPSTLLHAGYNATLFAGLFAAGDQVFGG